MSFDKTTKSTKLLVAEDVNECSSPTPEEHSCVFKTVAALVQAISSIGTQLLNKITLTTYAFPSANLLGLAHCVVPVMGLTIGKHVFGYHDLYPNITWARIWSTMPLPLFRVMSLGLSLVGAKALSIPMYIVLRGLAVPMSLFCEVYILDMPASRDVILSLIVLMTGIVIAAMSDLAFDAIGYAALIVSAIASTACVVLSKQILSGENERTKLEIVWIESAVNAPLFALVTFCNPITSGKVWNELVNFSYWQDVPFWLAFFGSACFQFFYTFGILFNVQVNGPLASIVVAATKNILTFYVGMLPLFGDYVFSWINFIGLNISMAGALWYCGAKLQQKSTTTTSAIPATQIDIEDADSTKKNRAVVESPKNCHFMEGCGRPEGGERKLSWYNCFACADYTMPIN